MKQVLLLFLFCALGIQLHAGTIITEAPITDKRAIAQKVFDRLVTARGDQSYPAPSLVFSTTPGKGASCKDGVITLDEQAYDVCASMGEAAEGALAMLLAHEVIHHYEKHQWEGGFISLVDPKTSQDASQVSAKVKEDLFAQRKDEVEADYLGGFLAHLAGYPATNVMPEVLEKIYKAYNLNENLSKYPPLKERQLIATQTYEKLNQLIDVFEMANLLAAIRQHDVASTYYDFLLRTFQSREIYNNAGVVYARAAIGMFRKETLTFIYPLELDLQSRLGDQSRGVETNKADRERYLLNAIDHFRRSSLLDRQYTRAVLNEACARTLLAQSILEPPATAQRAQEAEDNFLEAGILARRALRLATAAEDQKALANAHLLLGIIAAETGDKGQAKASFDNAGSGTLATLNKKILASGSLPAPNSAANDGLDYEEKINEQSISDFRVSPPEWQTDLLIAGGRNRIKFKAAHPDQGTSILHNIVGTGRKYVMVAMANRGYTGKTALEVAIGATREEVIEAYDQPSFYTPVSGGTIMVYEGSSIAFLVQNERVSRWYLYQVKL